VTHVAKVAQVIAKLKYTMRTKCTSCSGELWPKLYYPAQISQSVEQNPTWEAVSRSSSFCETSRFIIVSTV